MSLPALYAQPTDEASWKAWAWNHQANHFDIVEAGKRFQQTSLTLATNIGSLAGGFVMQFAATTGVQIGMAVSDVTTPSAIMAGSEVVALNATEVQIGLALAANVGNGDDILFSPGANVKALDQFQLSPVDPANLGFWLYQHSLMHQQINAVLGTSGYDLLSLDWQDEDQFAEWLNLNGDEHVRICSALGIG
jgi:hypothetical protein